MNNHQLESIMRLLVGDSFFGVYAEDELLALLKRSFKRPTYMIINTDPRNKPGTHWLAISLDEDGDASFYDSFGFPPDYLFYPKSIVTFLKKHAKRVSFHQRQLQATLSTVCGQHCIFFLANKSHGKSYEDVLALYSSDQIKNDSMVSYFVKRFIRCVLICNASNFNQTSCSLKAFNDCHLC